MTEEMDKFNFPVEPGYYYMTLNSGFTMQCAKESWHSDFPEWHIIPSQRARYMKKEKRRKRYERMMERGRSVKNV